MKTEIPHADLIRAVLDGKAVQNFWHGKWKDRSGADAVRFLVNWQEQDGEVRLKPEHVTKEQALAALSDMYSSSQNASALFDTLRRFIEEQP